MRAKRIWLRRWQQEALARFEASGSADFLTVATPGAGKTNFALAACVRALAAGRAQRVVVVAPTQHLKHQWSEAAQGFGLALEPAWSSPDRLPADLHGAVVTYQQVAANPEALRPLARGAFAILDEIHHAAESRAWGDGIRIALGAARYRLSLSGTPFRSDENPIPFVRYRADDAEPDYEYGYAEALADRRVVRPVYFPRVGGHMEWTAPDGTDYSHGFDDPIGRVLASQRLRTALSIEHDWLPAVLADAHAKLLELRKEDATAAGMVIALDQDHARGIARLLRERLRVSAALATSDDPQASEKIASFGRGRDPWIVAVRMVSEGVDLPRLRVGVYATNTVTELFFRQAVGRLVRWTAGVRRQAAYMFIPDDRRIRSFAQEIQQERRHSLRRRSDPGDRPPLERAGDGASEAEAPAQLSLFSVISAVAIHAVVPAADAETLEETVLRDETAGGPDEDDPPGLLELPYLAPAASAAAPGADPGAAGAAAIAPLPSPAGPRRRSELRALNAERAQQIARRSEQSHATVNAELNRGVGIRRIAEATAAQLERRLQLADAWLKRLGAERSSSGPTPRSRPAAPRPTR